MNRILTITGITLLSIQSCCWAEQLTLQQALSRLNQSSQAAAALRTLGQSIQSPDNQYKLTYTARVEESNQNLFYVLNAPSKVSDKSHHGGFLILSADDVAPALLAYGDTEFDTEHLPDNVKYWLKGYEKSIQLAIQKGQSFQATAVLGAPVPALIQTHWGQSDNYATLVQQKVNAAALDAGVAPYSTVTGCVATALAQVLNYYKYPAQGEGSVTYQFNHDIVQKTTDGRDTTVYVPLTLSADFSTSRYDWNHMANAYSYEWLNDTDYRYVETSPTENKAVAQLMYDCGVAVQMEYGYDSSNSWIDNCAYALYNYFGYDKSLRHEYRSCYDQEQWNAMIYNELAARRPVLYNGNAGESGHAFVCDGYSSDGLFHINWGWNGSCDGFFSLWGESALQPVEDYTGYRYTQHIVCGIQPDRGGEMSPDRFVCIEDVELMYYSDDTYDYESVQGLTFSQRPWLCLDGYVANSGIRHMNCLFGLKFENVDDPTLTYISARNDPYRMDVNYWLHAIYVNSNAVLKAGTYRVIPVWADTLAQVTDMDAWHVIPFVLGQNPPTITFTSDSRYSLSKYENGSPQPVSADKSYGLAGMAVFEGVMCAVPDKGIDRARLGLKFVLESDPSYVCIAPTSYSCFPKTMSNIYDYYIQALTMDIPKKGTYRVYPVWADWESDPYDDDNWQEIPRLMDELPCISFEEECLVRLASAPIVTFKTINNGYFPYLTFSVKANQAAPSTITVMVYVYQNTPEDPSRYSYQSSFTRSIGRPNRNKIVQITNLNLSSSRLEQGREYLYQLYYLYNDPQRGSVQQRISSREDNTFSIEDAVTAIDDLPIVDIVDCADRRFDLMGREIKHTAPSRIYIENDKKVLVR